MCLNLKSIYLMVLSLNNALFLSVFPVNIININNPIIYIDDVTLIKEIQTMKIVTGYEQIQSYVNKAKLQIRSEAVEVYRLEKQMLVLDVRLNELSIFASYDEFWWSKVKSLEI